MTDDTRNDDNGGSGSEPKSTGEFKRDQNYIATRITADGRDGYPVEPGRYRLVVSRACPWANRAIIVRRLLGLEDALSMGVCGPTHDERSWTFDLDPGGRRPGARHRAAAGGLLRPRPRLPAGHHRAGHRRRRRPAQVVTNDYAADHPRPVHRVARPTTGRARRDLYPEPLRDEIDEVNAGGLRRRQQRRLPVRLRRLPGGVRDGRTTGCSPGWTGCRERLDGPALPGRRHHHRGRRPAVHHAGPVRRRLPRPLQVQPAEAHRDAGAVGVRPRPVPDARASATPSTSTTSSGTTTWCTATSTRPGSSRPARTCPAGSNRTTGKPRRPAVRRRHAPAAGPARTRAVPPAHTPSAA